MTDTPSALRARAAIATSLERDEFKYMAASVDLPVLRAMVPPESGITAMDLNISVRNAMANLSTALISIRTATPAVRRALQEARELDATRARLAQVNLQDAPPSPPMAHGAAAAAAAENRDSDADDDEDEDEQRPRRRRAPRSREYARLAHREAWEVEDEEDDDDDGKQAPGAQAEEEDEEERREGDSDAQLLQSLAFREQVRELRASEDRVDEYAHVLEVMLSEVVPRLEWNPENAIMSVTRLSGTRATLQVKKFIRMSEEITLLLLQYYSRDAPPDRPPDEQSMAVAYEMLYQSLQPNRFMFSWSLPPAVWRRRAGAMYPCLRELLGVRNYEVTLEHKEATDIASQAISAAAAAAGVAAVEAESRAQEGALLASVGDALPSTKQMPVPQGYVLRSSLEMLALATTVVRMHVWAELHIPRHTPPNAVRADVPPQGVWVPPCVAFSDPRVAQLTRVLEARAALDQSGAVVLSRREVLARLLCGAGALSHAEIEAADSAADDGAFPIFAATRCNETEQENIDEANAFVKLTKELDVTKLRDATGALVHPYTPPVADALHIAQVEMQLAGLPMAEARAQQRSPDDPFRYSLFPRYYFSTLFDAASVATKPCRDEVMRGFCACSPIIHMIGMHESGETRWAVSSGPPPAFVHILSCFVYGRELSEAALKELRAAHVRPERRRWMLCRSFAHALRVWIELVRLATVENDAHERVAGDSDRDDSDDEDGDAMEGGGAAGASRRQRREERIARLDVNICLPAEWL